MRASAYRHGTSTERRTGSWTASAQRIDGRLVEYTDALARLAYDEVLGRVFVRVPQVRAAEDIEVSMNRAMVPGQAIVPRQQESVIGALPVVRTESVVLYATTTTTTHDVRSASERGCVCTPSIRTIDQIIEHQHGAVLASAFELRGGNRFLGAQVRACVCAHALDQSRQ